MFSKYKLVKEGVEIYIFKFWVGILWYKFFIFVVIVLLRGISVLFDSKFGYKFIMDRLKEKGVWFKKCNFWFKEKFCNI